MIHNPYLQHTYSPLHLNHPFQDPEGGGIADRPGDMVDVFHTHFGIAGVWLNFAWLDHSF